MKALRAAVRAFWKAVWPVRYLASCAVTAFGRVAGHYNSFVIAETNRQWRWDAHTRAERIAWAHTMRVSSHIGLWMMWAALTPLKAWTLVPHFLMCALTCDRWQEVPTRASLLSLLFVLPLKWY